MVYTTFGVWSLGFGLVTNLFSFVIVFHHDHEGRQDCLLTEHPTILGMESIVVVKSPLLFILPVKCGLF